MNGVRTYHSERSKQDFRSEMCRLREEMRRTPAQSDDIVSIAKRLKTNKKSQRITLADVFLASRKSDG